MILIPTIYMLQNPAIYMWFDKISGCEYWYKAGELHREDGPAVTLFNGTQYWYRDGVLHRENGPAVTRASGAQEWWVNGKQVDPVVSSV